MPILCLSVFDYLLYVYLDAFLLRPLAILLDKQCPAVKTAQQDATDCSSCKSVLKQALLIHQEDCYQSLQSLQVDHAGWIGSKGLAITLVASAEDADVLNQVCELFFCCHLNTSCALCLHTIVVE